MNNSSSSFLSFNSKKQRTRFQEKEEDRQLSFFLDPPNPSFSFKDKAKRVSSISLQALPRTPRDG